MKKAAGLTMCLIAFALQSYAQSDVPSIHGAVPSFATHPPQLTITGTHFGTAPPTITLDGQPVSSILSHTETIGRLHLLERPAAKLLPSDLNQQRQEPLPRVEAGPPMTPARGPFLKLVLKLVLKLEQAGWAGISNGT
jgi:hypothetical protein